MLHHLEFVPITKVDTREGLHKWSSVKCEQVVKPINCGKSQPSGPSVCPPSLLPRTTPRLYNVCTRATDVHIAHTELNSAPLQMAQQEDSWPYVRTPSGHRSHPCNSFRHPRSPWVSVAAAKRCRVIGFRHLSSRLRDRRMTMAPSIHVSHKSYGWPA